MTSEHLVAVPKSLLDKLPLASSMAAGSDLTEKIAKEITPAYILSKIDNHEQKLEVLHNPNLTAEKKLILLNSLDQRKSSMPIERIYPQPQIPEQQPQPQPQQEPIPDQPGQSIKRLDVQTVTDMLTEHRFFKKTKIKKPIAISLLGHMLNNGVAVNDDFTIEIGGITLEESNIWKILNNLTTKTELNTLPIGMPKVIELLKRINIPENLVKNRFRKSDIFGSQQVGSGATFIKRRTKLIGKQHGLGSNISTFKREQMTKRINNQRKLARILLHRKKVKPVMHKIMKKWISY